MFFTTIRLFPLVFLLPWMLFLRLWERPSIGRSEVFLTESFALLKQRSALGIFLGFFAYDYVFMTPLGVSDSVFLGGNPPLQPTVSIL